MVVHVPFNAGFACGTSVGMLVPLPSFAVHTCVVSTHHCPPTQSASTLQPSAGWHKPLLLQLAERQTAVAVPAVHGPAFTPYPHLLSAASHTAAWQTKVAAPNEHVLSKVGLLCGASVGMLVPFVNLAVHACEVSLHHWPPVQSASTLHPPMG